METNTLLNYREQVFRFSVPEEPRTFDQLLRLWRGSAAKKAVVVSVIENAIHTSLYSYGHSTFITKHPGPCISFSASQPELDALALAGRFQRLDVAKPWSATSSLDSDDVRAEIAARVPLATASPAEDDLDLAYEVLNQVRQKLADAAQKVRTTLPYYRWA